MQCFLKVTLQNNEKIKILNWITIPTDFVLISSGSPVNKQKSSPLQGIISTLDLCRT